MNTTILSDGNIIKTFGSNLNDRHRYIVHSYIYLNSLEKSDKDKIDINYYESDVRIFKKFNNTEKKLK